MFWICWLVLLWLYWFQMLWNVVCNWCFWNLLWNTLSFLKGFDELSSLFGFRSWLCRMCKKIPMLYWGEMMLTNGFSIFYWLLCCTWNLELFVRKNVRELQFRGIWKWWKAIRIFEGLSKWFRVSRFVVFDHECVLNDSVVWGDKTCEDGSSKKNQAHCFCKCIFLKIFVTIMVSRI